MDYMTYGLYDCIQGLMYFEMRPDVHDLINYY